MTTYVAPRVNVYQEYATMSVSASNADFIPIIIGPCYHVIDEATDEDSAYLMDYTDSGIVSQYLPSLKSGSVVDPASVKVRFKDMRVLYKENFAVTTISANGNILSFSDLALHDIEVGDYIDVKNSATSAVLYADRRVLAVDIINNTITLNYACTTAVQTISVDVIRPVTDFTLSKNSDGIYIARNIDNTIISYTGGVISVDIEDSKLDMTPIYIVIEGSASKAVYAKTYIGYIARVTSLNRILEFDTITSALETLGVADVRNPLGMAASILSANMTKIPFKTFATVDDTLVSWVAAKDAISTDPNIYSIVPLTQDTSILAMFKDHAEEASSPEVAMFRMCMGSASLDLDTEVERGVVLSSGTGTIELNDDSILCLLTDENATFQTDGVLIGDQIRLYDTNEIATLFTISDVIGGNRVKADPRFPFEVNGGADITTYNYVSNGLNDGYVQTDNASLHDTSPSILVGNPVDGGSTDGYVLFNNITVGADVSTTSAYLKLKAAAAMSNQVALKVFGVIGASNISAPASKVAFEALTLTTAFVSWNLSSITSNTVYSSPDLSAIIDEIVAENTWERGGTVMFVIQDNSSSSGNYGTFYSYDIDGGLNKPELDITFPPGTFVADSAYTYEIIHQLSIGQLATAYKELSQSLTTTTRANMVNIFPTSCYITNIDEEQPGYYLAAAVAGRCGDTPGHQSLTRSSVSGIDKLGSLNTFNSTQLDTIASGGTFIFTQANESAAPIIRHQLTTKMDSIEFRELSFVRNFDYVSNILKGIMDVYIGRYNITPTNLALMGSALNGTLKSLSLSSQPVIGPPVMSYKVVSISQLPEQRDRVEVYVNILFPYTLNYIGLHIVSQ